MQVYRFVWMVTAAVVLATAFAHDIAAGGLPRMAGLATVLAAFGGMLAFALAEGRRDRWSWVRRSAAGSALVGVSTDALGTTWASSGVALGTVLLLSSPAVLAQARSVVVWWSSRRRSGPPESLTLWDLHRRWESTTAEILHPNTSVARRLVLVEERRRLLDELQRCDPAHFDAWLVAAVPDLRPRRPGPWSQ